MAKPRLGMIGCGQIAEFHAPAFRAAGFDLAAVCSRPGSERVRAFADRHEIPDVFDSPIDLVAARDKWDALLIAVSIDATLDILKMALALNAPTLVEKPVSRRSADLESIADGSHGVLVGYNRRFYGAVQAARSEEAGNAPHVAIMSMPESIPTPGDPADDPAYLARFFTNSVHGLDILRFVFGDLSVEKVHRVMNDGGALQGFAAILSAPSGSVVQLNANWRAPGQFTFTLDRPGHRLELRPFEQGIIYEGMDIVQPTHANPIRSYHPKEVGRVQIEAQDRDFKAGFVAQAEALGVLVRGAQPRDAATLKDAHNVLMLAEQLVGQEFDSGKSG